MITKFYRGISLGAVLAAALTGTACGGDGEAAPTAQIGVNLQRAYPNLTFNAPTAMLQAPGDSSRWFVAERAGVVRSFDALDPGAAISTVALSIEVDDSGEGGLLGLALHPQFANNGQAFLSYTITGPGGGTPLISRVSRVTSANGGRTFDPASEEILLTLPQPFINHNGGHIAFGPDGYLYIGFGDGGSAGDPFGHAQNANNFYGALLRIDVDNGTPYAIPPDNPFVDGGGRPAIYAYGLRNPWRFSFDRAMGRLWLGDVGQGDREEIDLIVKGGNYGWRCYEGSLEYELAGCGARGRYRFPVAEYGHNEGESITGGFIYRGSTIPALRGVYVFGDFISGTIWGLFPRAGGALDRRVLTTSELGVVSFAESNDGELYVLDLFEGGLYRIVAKTR
jgi:glucose/arabinose dehydrogenase